MTRDNPPRIAVALCVSLQVRAGISVDGDGMSLPDRRGPYDWLTAGALLASCMPTGPAAA
jgi:hypothetical protein